MLRWRVAGVLLVLFVGPILRLGAGVEDMTMTTYHDVALGLSYQYPARFEPSPGLGRALAGGTPDSSDPDAALRAKCLKIPVSGAKETKVPGGGIELGIVVMLQADHTCLGESGSAAELGEAAQTMMKALVRFGRPVTEDAVHYELDGHEASFVQGTASAKMLGEGKMLHAGSVCALVRTNTVCWLLVNTDYKAMPGLVGTLVTFDGHAAVPLVPKDMVPKW